MKPKSKPSSFRLRATLRSRRSWTRWHLRRTQHRLQREVRRLVLLQQLTDSQLLLVKQLEQRLHPLLQAPQELQESREYREAGSPPLLLQGPMEPLVPQAPPMLLLEPVEPVRVNLHHPPPPQQPLTPEQLNDLLTGRQPRQT